VDTSFLLGGKGVEAPDPIAMAGKGLTLAQLMNTVQASQLGLDTQRANIAAISSPDYFPALGLGGGGAPSMEALQRIIQANPLAGPDLLKRSFDLQKEQATIAKDRAEALAKEVESRTKQVGTMSNFAMKAAETPTPQNIQGYLRQHSFAGLPSDFFGPMPPLGSSKEAWQSYLAGVASASQDPAAQLAIAKQAVMLPREAAASDVGTAKAQLEKEQLPQQLDIKQQEANTGSFGAETKRAEFTAPEMFFVPGDNTPHFRQKDMSGGMTSAPGVGTTGGRITSNTGPRNPFAQSPGETASPAVTDMQIAPLTPQQQRVAQAGQAPSTPPTIGPTPQAVELGKEDVKKASEYASRMPEARGALDSIFDLRNQIAKGEGLFSGPVRGSDFFKTVAGIVSQMPGTSDALRAAVSNTQAYDAQSMQLVLKLMGEQKGITPRSMAGLQAVASAKVNSFQTPQAMLQILNSLEDDARRQLAYARESAKTVSGGKPLAETPMPGRGETKVTKRPDGSYEFNLNP
jgi:hypothetical protein